MAANLNIRRAEREILELVAYTICSFDPSLYCFPTTDDRVDHGCRIYPA
jgi:hypothetical protein